MKYLLAPDKFKGALSAIEACEAMKAGLSGLDAQPEVLSVPMADGGEGTMAVLTHHAGGEYRTVNAHDPYGRLLKAPVGLSLDGKTAFLEMAKASGLQILATEERNCYETSSRGVGDLILEAWQLGVERIILGIGGSATCDGGMGMATALGYQFYDQNGQELKPAGNNLLAISRIDAQAVPEGLKALDIQVACDVNNFLTGPKGAAKVFGPQKGANEHQVEELEAGLKNLAHQWQSHFGIKLENVPGSGAAGGLGAGAKAFLGAALKPGVDLVMDQVRLKDWLEEADLVITGEGKLDDQTIHGKVIHGVGNIANKAHVPVLALCGTLNASEDIIYSLGLSYATSIIREPASLETSLPNTAKDLQYATFQLGMLLGKLYPMHNE